MNYWPAAETLRAFLFSRPCPPKPYVSTRGIYVGGAGRYHKKNTAPAQETAERTEDATATQETAEQAGEATTTQETAEQEEGTAPAKETPERDILAGIQNPCVYCGPTMRGVARQYTTFQGGIPDALRDFIKEHPEARQLIVSTAQFPAMRRRLDTPGTAEAKLYKQVKELLGK